MTVLLENVRDEQLAVFRELARAFHLTMSELDEPSAELKRRIERVESGQADLMTPDWETIVRKAEAIS